MAGRLKKEKQKIYLSQGNLKKKMIPRIFFMAYLGINVIVLTGIPVYASDIFATAKNAMQTVYTDVAGIATVAAVVCAAVCLFLMNFSKSGRTVDESRSWLKRIVVCWAALMTLGAIVTYLEMETRDLLDGYTSERSELASKIQSLHIFFSLLIPDMSHEEKQLLDGAMVTCYQEKGITHDNLSLTDPEHPGKYKKMPILGDLHEVLMRKEECRRMANILNRLVSGSASSFNQQTNVDLENKYVVLDISELSGDLLLGMFVALDFVWTKTKEDRTVEKAVFVDEAWKLLMSNDLAGEYLIEIFKTIRAYGGSAICATQDLADCFAVRDGKLGRGILSNSKTKIVLNMEVSEAERIQEELDLSEAETNSIIHFERGNGLISTNNNNLIVEFKASDLEKDLITTDRKDLQELKDRLRKYGTDAYGRK